MVKRQERLGQLFNRQGELPPWDVPLLWNSIEWNPLPIRWAIGRKERSTENVRKPQFTGRNHRFVTLTWKTGKSSEKKKN